MAGDSRGTTGRVGRSGKEAPEDGAARKSGRKPASTVAAEITQGGAFPVVGIGASAGGIEALSLFFDACRPTAAAPS